MEKMKGYENVGEEACKDIKASLASLKSEEKAVRTEKTL